MEVPAQRRPSHYPCSTVPLRCAIYRSDYRPHSFDMNLNCFPVRSDEKVEFDRNVEESLPMVSLSKIDPHRRH